MGMFSLFKYFFFLSFFVFLSFFLSLIYLFIERGKGGRKRGRQTLMRERNLSLLPLACSLTRDQTHDPGMCPDQQSNLRPFALWDNAQPTKPHRSGLGMFSQCVDSTVYISLHDCYLHVLKYKYYIHM